MTDLFIEVRLGSQRTHRLSVASDEITIGRNPANSIALTDARISNHHAKLVREQGRLVLVDLGSLHGTQLRGQRIKAAVVNPGDEFQLGPYTLKVVLHSEDAATDAPITQFRSGIQDLLKLTTIFTVTDRQAILETLLEQTIRLMSAQRGFVVLAQDGQLSPVLAHQGISTDEDFSRTICNRALHDRKTVLVSEDDAAQLQNIRSLAGRQPKLVLAIPLTDGDDALGVLYLECDQFLNQTLLTHLELLSEVSSLGGRALRGALERNQVVIDRERWRFLAQVSDEPDLARTCRSVAMKPVLALVERVSAADVTVLILGESGTGKEVTARAIHRHSARRAGPFVAVNCGAIPKELMEGEFFGYEKGAFTGAQTRTPGRLELAQGGTLLLDEIGELPRELQVKLLRVLETRTFERLGGREPIRLDTRILAATNRDLTAAIARGEFREDLFYRLNVVTLTLPPLRDRTEDIELLTGEMMAAGNRRYPNKLFGISPEALRAFEAYDWPGNVRELRNVIERAFVIESSDRITLESIPVHQKKEGTAPPKRPTAPEPRPVQTLQEFMRTQERQYVNLILSSTSGNVTQAARHLGLTRSALHKKMRQLGIRGGSSSEDH
jgi:transcriptional regulator with GAF, ATPase, and Fis domain